MGFQKAAEEMSWAAFEAGLLDGAFWASRSKRLTFSSRMPVSLPVGSMK